MTLDDSNGIILLSPTRLYHVKVGRFLQRDMLGFVDGLNLYRAFMGNPIGYMDAEGRQSFLGDRDKGFSLSPAAQKYLEKNYQEEQLKRKKKIQAVVKGILNKYEDYFTFENEKKLFSPLETARISVGRSTLLALYRANGLYWRPGHIIFLNENFEGLIPYTEKGGYQCDIEHRAVLHELLHAAFYFENPLPFTREQEEHYMSEYFIEGAILNAIGSIEILIQLDTPEYLEMLDKGDVNIQELIKNNYIRVIKAIEFAKTMETLAYISQMNSILGFNQKLEEALIRKVPRKIREYGEKIIKINH